MVGGTLAVVLAQMRWPDKVLDNSGVSRGFGADDLLAL